MSSSNSSQTHESNHENKETHVSESSEPQAALKGPSPSDPPPAEEEALEDLEIKEDVSSVDPEGEEGQEEEEGECGFCLYMKGGGCRDEFIEWEKCVEEGEKNKEDIAEKCFDITGNLKKCMEAHRDYYEPLLVAEEKSMKEWEEKGNEEESGSAVDEAASDHTKEELGSAVKVSDTDSEEEKVKGSAN